MSFWMADHVSKPKKAQKSLFKMPIHYQKRVKELINTLGSDAIPAEFYDIQKLQGREDEYRIRIGDIRVLYAVLWDEEQIEIYDITWRGKAY